MFAPGDRVVVLPPFGDGATPMVVVQVQHVTAEGEIVAEPAAAVQYVLAAEPEGEGCAYASNLVEAAP